MFTRSLIPWTLCPRRTPQRLPPPPLLSKRQPAAPPDTVRVAARNAARGCPRSCPQRRPRLPTQLPATPPAAAHAAVRNTTRYCPHGGPRAARRPSTQLGRGLVRLRRRHPPHRWVPTAQRRLRSPGSGAARPPPSASGIFPHQGPRRPAGYTLPHSNQQNRAGNLFPLARRQGFLHALPPFSTTVPLGPPATAERRPD